jgi:hypothetical protein
MNFNPEFTEPSLLFPKLMNVRSISRVMIGVCLALASSGAIHSQDPPATVSPPNQFFAGTITALSETSVTVTRTVLGKDATVRTFAITHETVIEGGKLKLKSRVTVKWLASEGGDRAVKIILRGSVPPPKKP